jgi:uncharacterized protein (DUF2225 family)
MKCPKCGERFERQTRLVLRSTVFYNQTRLDLSVEQKNIRVTKTLYDSEWYCPECFEQIDAALSDNQKTIQECEEQPRWSIRTDTETLANHTIK